jgi:hypothetical protein
VDGSLGGFQIFRTVKKIQTALKMHSQMNQMNLRKVHSRNQPRKIKEKAKGPSKILDAA